MNLQIKILLYIFIISLFSQGLYSQVTIGSGIPPKAGALLDLKEYDDDIAQQGGRTAVKGLGLPRVEIVTSNQLELDGYTGSLDADEHIGLLVYNTGSECVGKGLFVWDGIEWTQLSGEKKGSYESDLAALRKLYDNNPGNTLDWDFILGTFTGVSWTTVCGEKRVSRLQIHNKKLTSLQNIGEFTALTALGCDNNQLQKLDLSNNTALTTLYCSDNQLQELNLSNNTALTILACYTNQLQKLDLSNNIALTALGCSDNQLQELDLTNNTALISLVCDNNQLSQSEINKIAQHPNYCFRSSCIVTPQYKPGTTENAGIIKPACP